MMQSIRNLFASASTSTALCDTAPETTPVDLSSSRDVLQAAGRAEVRRPRAAASARPDAPRQTRRRATGRTWSASPILCGLLLGAAGGLRGAAAVGSNGGGMSVGGRNCVPFATRDIANISYGFLACAGDGYPAGLGQCATSPWCYSYNDGMLQSTVDLLKSIQGHTPASGPGTRPTELFLGRLSDNSAFVYASAVDTGNEAQNFIRSHLDNANAVGF